MKTPAMLAIAGSSPLAATTHAAATAKPRAVITMPRAEAPADPAATLVALNVAATEMRATIDGLKAKVDPLDLAKIEAMNVTVGELQSALNATNEQLAAIKLGGSGTATGLSAKDREHGAAFGVFARTGTVEARGATFSDPDGGFLTPKQIDTAITRILGKTVAMRRLATTISISGDTYVKHKGLGGASSGWVGEGDTRAETATPKLARMEFVTGELFAEPAATQKLLDDAVADVEGWYSNEVAIEFAEQEGAAFIAGDGVKKPRGFLAYPTVANANYAWGKIGFVKTGDAAALPAAGQTDWAIDLVHSLKAAYRQSAAFLMNDLSLAAIRKLKDGAGNYLWQPSTQVDMPELLLGYRVETDDNMPDIGAGAFPIAFGDMARAYLIVDRLGVRVLRNPYKTNGVVFFYSTKRVGGGVQNYEALKLLKVTA